MRRPHTATALALALALVTGCGGSDDDGGDGGGGDAGPGTVLGGLAALPDSGDDEQVGWSDLAAARELAGVERPDIEDTQAVVDYITALTGTGPDAGAVAALPPEAVNIVRSNDITEFADEVGWSLVDVDRFVERQVPPDVVTVMGGEFDTGAIGDAADEGDGDPWVVGDPEGGQDLASSSAARPLGEPMFLADADGTLVVSSGTDDTGPVVDALGGDADGATLADDQGLGALGAALDEAGAYSALLVRPGVAAGAVDLDSPEQAARACDAALPSPTIATATGIADDDGPVLLVVHAHDAAGAAEANAAALEDLVAEGTSLTGQPYAELVTLDGVEVTGEDGTVVVARLRPAGDRPARLWVDLLFRREGIVSYC